MTRWTIRRAPAAAPRRAFLFRLAALLPALAADRAQAQQRPFPEAALRGRLKVTAPPLVELDGRSDSLSPGARIRNTQNLFVPSGTLVGQDLVVNYLRDPGGQIIEVWVLTAAEAAVKRASAPQRSLYDTLFGS